MYIYSYIMLCAYYCIYMKNNFFDFWFEFSKMMLLLIVFEFFFTYIRIGVKK